MGEDRSCLERDSLELQGEVGVNEIRHHFLGGKEKWFLNFLNEDSIGKSRKAENRTLQRGQFLC